MKPKSGIDALSPELKVKEDTALPQFPLVLLTVNYIQAEDKEPKAGWTAPLQIQEVLAPSNIIKQMVRCFLCLIMPN